MSLFGESPPSSRPTKSSLFDEEPASKPGSGLFADEGSANTASPWDFPSPKKNARRNLVKSLLQGSEFPDSYVDAYDTMLQSDATAEGGVSVAAARKLVAETKIGQGDQDKIFEIVGGSADGLGRSEFNVLLALIGLAQEGEELSLDAVDERRRRLPIPSLPSLQRTKKSQPKLEPPTNASGPPTAPAGGPPGNMRGFAEEDPWGSPAMHKGHDHSAQNGNAPFVNGGNPHGPSRTTSTFTTSAEEQPDTSTTPNFEASQSGSTPSEGPGWGSYGSAQGNGFSAPGAGGDPGFGGPAGDEGAGPGNPSRPIGASKRTGGVIEEVVTVNILDEKEGMFFFQHRNYEVASVRRNSKVIRRYSDFVWLLDCLHKRYPFRQLPLLPPKRVAINGNHIAADNTFVEKRRRGLARFVNALVRHPVLNQEQLVIMFLSVPTVDELAVWRKQATISVQEEFTGKSLPPGLEDSLPSTLPDLFDTVRSGVRRSAEIYINLCNMIEKLTKYNVGLAAEYMRVSLALESLTEVSADTFAIDTNDVPLLNEGMKSTAKHLSTNQTLLEDEGRAWDMGVLEDLKRQRDCLVSVRDMFDRRDRYAKDNIPQLERRIGNNENKLAGLRARPDGQGKPGEAEKLEDAIMKDKKSIVEQHARGVFIKECIRDECLFFNSSQFHISRMHQDWSQERVKYAELGADNWRGLSEELEGMPLGD